MNPSDEPLAGSVSFFAFSGEPFTIGGTSEVALQIPARGTYVWESAEAGMTVETGFAMVTASSGRPVASVTVSTWTGPTLVSEHAVDGGSAQEAWFPIDTYPSVVRHGQTSFRLTVTNANEGTADVRLLVYDEDGNLLDRSYQILPAGRQVEFTHVDLADRGKFKGSVRVVSDIPITVSAEQRTVNVRNETIVATVPSMTRASGGRTLDEVVFPAYADGPDQATQLFLLNRGDAGRATFSFRGQNGDALNAILR